MNGDEDYVAIVVTVLHITPRAVHILAANDVRQWIPRSLVFGPDERTLPSKVGQLTEIRIFRWCASKGGIPIAER